MIKGSKLSQDSSEGGLMVRDILNSLQGLIETDDDSDIVETIGFYLGMISTHVTSYYAVSVEHGKAFTQLLLDDLANNQELPDGIKSTLELIIKLTDEDSTLFQLKVESYLFK